MAHALQGLKKHKCRIEHMHLNNTEVTKLKKKISQQDIHLNAKANRRRNIGDADLHCRKKNN